MLTFPAAYVLLHTALTSYCLLFLLRTVPTPYFSCFLLLWLPTSCCLCLLRASFFSYVWLLTAYFWLVALCSSYFLSAYFLRLTSYCLLFLLLNSSFSYFLCFLHVTPYCYDFLHLTILTPNSLLFLLHTSYCVTSYFLRFVLFTAGFSYLSFLLLLTPLAHYSYYVLRLTPYVLLFLLFLVVVLTSYFLLFRLLTSQCSYLVILAPLISYVRTFDFSDDLLLLLRTSYMSYFLLPIVPDAYFLLFPRRSANCSYCSRLTSYSSCF